jgi:hypothetical protein
MDKSYHNFEACRIVWPKNARMSTFRIAEAHHPVDCPRRLDFGCLDSNEASCHQGFILNTLYIQIVPLSIRITIQMLK